MSEDLKKGFNTTMGIVLALVFLFIILPTATCAGCMVLGTAASVGTAASDEAARDTKTGEPTKPDIEISNIAWKVLDSNRFLHEATFKFDVTNNKTRAVTKSFYIVFKDADGLPIDETYELGKKIGPGATLTVSGKSMMEPAKSGLLATMEVQEK